MSGPRGSLGVLVAVLALGLGACGGGDSGGSTSITTTTTVGSSGSSQKTVVVQSHGDSFDPESVYQAAA